MEKLTQLQLLNLAFEGVQARENANERLKQIVISMYKEEVAAAQKANNLAKDKQAVEETQDDLINKAQNTEE